MTMSKPLFMDTKEFPEFSSKNSTRENGPITSTQQLHCFEGPEKILEVDFIPLIDNKNPIKVHPLGLRAIPRNKWDSILAKAKCEILSLKANVHFDAYVLSESSLFVYERKAYIKTCGTTTLLLCLDMLLKEAEKVGLKLEWVGYSRKDFLFPQQQCFPHTSFSQEIEFTESALGRELSGAAFVLGDITRDHCYVYVADYCERSEELGLDRNLNIMMYGLDPSVQKLFYMKTDDTSSEGLKAEGLRARKESGISSIKFIKDSIFDDTLFEPCGYSLNALCGEAFFTIHITPENHCCYASFETNLDLNSDEYRTLLQEVLTVFKPQKFTLTMFADRAGLRKIEMSPYDFGKLVGKDEKGKDSLFVRTSQTSSCFATDYVCQLANFVKQA